MTVTAAVRAQPVVLFAPPPKEKHEADKTLAYQVSVTRFSVQPRSPMLKHLQERMLDTGAADADRNDELYQMAAAQEARLRSAERQTLLGLLAYASDLPDADGEMGTDVPTPRQLLDIQLSPKEGRHEQGIGSINEDFDKIFDLIRQLDEDWISKYSDILSDYVAFFDALTKAMAHFTDVIGNIDDKGNLGVNFNNLRTELANLQAMVAKGLGPPFDSQADAQAFLDELGLEGLKVIEVDGKFKVAVDKQLIEDLRNIFPDSPPAPDTTYMSTSRLNAIIAARDGLMERFNHVNRVLPEKYQRQLQMWDTLVKVLSGTIDSVREANRLFVQNLA